MQVEKSKARARVQQERIKRQMEAKRKSIAAAEAAGDAAYPCRDRVPTAEEVAVFSRASLLATDPGSTRVDKDSWQARQEAAVAAPPDLRTLSQQESEMILQHRREAVLVSEGHLSYEIAAVESLVSGGATTTTLSGYVHKQPERAAPAVPLAETTEDEANMRNAVPVPAPLVGAMDGGGSPVILPREFRLSQTFAAESERQTI
eukprot:COSAG05_NODE_952_length_6466_cov_3.122350_7_plen_204_part_00